MVVPDSCFISFISLRDLDPPATGGSFFA